MSFEDWIELLSSECYLFSYWKLHPYPKPFLSSVTSFLDSKIHILLNRLIISCAIVLNLGKHDLGEYLLKKTLLGTCYRSVVGKMCLGGSGCVLGSSRTTQLYLSKLLLLSRVVLELLQEAVAQLYYSWKPQVPFSLQYHPFAASDSEDGQSQYKWPTPLQDIIWNSPHCLHIEQHIGCGKHLQLL